MSVESDVLEKIRPSEEERAAIREAAEKLRRAVRKYIENEGIEAEIRFVGSFSKDTYLSDPDLDLFILFPPTVPRRELERIGLKMGDDILHGTRMFSEHPYTRGRYEGVDVDLVPSYHIDDTSRLQSAVDRTPFHTDYVLANMAPEQRDQARLLKRFMKGIGAYGAEPDTRGFSGYLCEILVMKYGSFDGVLEAAAGEWREGTNIVIRERGPPMIGPLVVYDPVDKRRNVASAVHLDTLALFIVAAKDYLAKPSESFFFPRRRRPFTEEEIEERASRHGSRILTVEFKRPDSTEDNLYSQLWKTQYALIEKLNDFDFNVLRAVHSMDGDRLAIAFELERDVLSKTARHVGPPVWVRAADNFLQKWRGGEFGEPFVENGSWNVINERMYFTAQEMIEDEAAIAGIGREIDPDSMEVRGHERSVAESDRLLLTELMDPVLSWKVERLRNGCRSPLPPNPSGAPSPGTCPLQKPSQSGHPDRLVLLLTPAGTHEGGRSSAGGGIPPAAPEVTRRRRCRRGHPRPPNADGLEPVEEWAECVPAALSNGPMTFRRTAWTKRTAFDFGEIRVRHRRPACATEGASV